MSFPIKEKIESQVLQDIINMDRYIIDIDYSPKSFEQVMFKGSKEECKQWVINHTRLTDFVVSETF